MYFSFEQQPPPATTLFLRVDGVPESVVPTLRATVRALEPNALVFDVRPFSAIASQSAAIPNLAMRVLAGFAVLALTLAGVGIYGVMSYTVRRRTRELGTRLALGATRVDILRLVLRQASMLVLAGLAIGIAIGVLATRSLAAVLHGVTPWDPLAITLAAVILALTALAASYLPARRAARIDPARTLSAE
jgi:putative ABC transport system permease protein